MTAYNHLIVFEPDILGGSFFEGTYEDVVFIKRENRLDPDLSSMQKLDFHNNQGRNVALYTDCLFDRTKKGQIWTFDTEEVVTFSWVSGTKTLRYVPGTNFSSELLKYWTLHIVLPLFFTIEETYDFLHAGAVLIEGRPVLFIAESFGGKSTMTDFFLKNAHPMISDDKVGIVQKNGTYRAIPSHPHHRPYRNTEDLGFVVNNMAASPLPIHAVFELEQAKPDAKIEITELTGIEKFKSLRFSSEMNLSFLKPQRMRALSLLANTVPLFRVHVPWDLKRLSEVHESICKHSRGVK